MSMYLDQGIFRLSMKAEDLDELIFLNIIYQISNVLHISLALVFLAIVTRVHNMQKENLESANKQM